MLTKETNFKLADLRDADFTNAKLIKANFEGAEVYGTIVAESELGNNPNM